MVINLNRYRKGRRRAEAQRHAAENRVRFGRGKDERSRDAMANARARKEIEDKRLE